MKIVFFSTNSYTFDAASLDIRTFPTRKVQWERLAEKYPEHDFVLATMLPGTFLVDSFAPAGAQGRVSVVLLQQGTAECIAAQITGLHPDLAVAASFWVAPYDWLALRDASVAEILRASGIRTVCQDSGTALTCFDKFRTNQMLSRLGFPVPRAVFVHHALFWSERGRESVQVNVYKEYVLQEIRKLRLPLVIKDTVGLSSYGMEVVSSYGEARAFLCSKKNNSDRIVEEYISGLQFGAEIHCSGDCCTVLPPFLFSVNKYGITSPKQSVKIGPVRGEAFRLPELNAMLSRLAKEMHFGAVAQVDLVFSGETWYIIEINPRLSGMTETYAAAQGRSLPELLAENALASGGCPPMSCVCNLKLPILPVERLEELAALPFVHFVQQIHNKAARQERERGYGEVIFGCTRTGGELLAQLDEIARRFPDAMEAVFLQNARGLAALLQD